MRKVLVIAVAGAVLLIASVAHADGFGSAFGNLTTARVVGHGKANFLGGIGIADATSFFGAVTFGLSSEIDGRLKLGLIDPDGGDTEFTLGADFKWQIWRAGVTDGEPIDLAVGGLFEWVDFGRVSATQLGGTVSGSYPFQLKNGDILSPYARLNARVESVNFDAVGTLGDSSDSDLRLGLHAGVCWQVTSVTSFYGEFQLDGNEGLFIGLDFNVM